MRPGFWTSLILLIPGVRRAYDIAAEKALEAAHFQGEILAMRSRLEALETERAQMSLDKDAAYKLVINIFSQYSWGKKQFENIGGMPEQFHPREGAVQPDSVNASALVSRRSGKAFEDFYRDMEKMNAGSD
jgi:hypothetical protein